MYHTCLEMAHLPECSCKLLTQRYTLRLLRHAQIRSTWPPWPGYPLQNAGAQYVETVLEDFGQRQERRC